MDRFHGEERYRGLGRRPEDWTISVSPAPAPPRPLAGAGSELLLLGALAAFLLDTFAPWQRICLNLNTSFFHLNGCLSANAWSWSGGGFGVAAGIATILACMAIVLHRTQALAGDSAEWLEQVLVYTAVGAGAVKWLLVIDKAASYGAWIGM